MIFINDRLDNESRIARKLLFSFPTNKFIFENCRLGESFGLENSRISREINPTKVGKISAVKKFRRAAREFERKLKKKGRKEGRKEGRKKGRKSGTAAGASPGRRGEKSGESRKVCERLSKSKVVKFTVSRGSGAKGKRATTFDVTMVDVHLYGSHCNLHCAFALENARDIALHARDGVRARTRVEFGTYASSEREERLFHKIVVPLIH